MHGAPLLHGVEIYRGRPIFYDLGNFIYNVPPTLTYIREPMSWESAVADLEYQARRSALRSRCKPDRAQLNVLGNGQADLQEPRTRATSSCSRAGCRPGRKGAEAGTCWSASRNTAKPFGTRLAIGDGSATIELRRH